MHDDLYSRISARISDTEQRLNFKFDRVNSDVKALARPRRRMTRRRRNLAQLRIRTIPCSV